MAFGPGGRTRARKYVKLFSVSGVKFVRGVDHQGNHTMHCLVAHCTPLTNHPARAASTRLAQ